MSQRTMSPPEEHHGRRRRVALLVAVVVGLVVAAGVLLTLRDTARPVSVEDARGRTTSTTGEGGSDRATIRPAAGVYRYAGTGTETLSTPPLSQDQGPTMPGTVEWSAEGCWSFRLDFSTNHWQSWTYCPKGDLTVETGGSSWQRWMIGATAITNLSSFDCARGTVLALRDARTAVDQGQEWPAECTGTNEAVAGTTTSAGTTRAVGVEDLRIDGDAVPALHVVLERTLQGAQVGTERTDAWFALDSGLPLRNERRVEAATDTPIGSSTYTEQGSFELTSLQPS